MYRGTVLVAGDRGGYKRIKYSEFKKDKHLYERKRKVLWGKRRRYWKKPPEPAVVRVTVGWHGVAEGEYRSVTYQEWVEDHEDEIEAAKERGVYQGRKPGSTKAKPARARELRDRGLRDREIAEALGVSRRSVQRYLRAAG